MASTSSSEIPVKRRSPGNGKDPGVAGEDLGEENLA
jgi:hypothetical protein